MNYLKNKKGFTLIELLAVIVILALLVLIATPIVQRVIANSQQNTFKDEVQSFSGYLDTAYSDYLMGSTKDTTKSGDFCVRSSGRKVTVCATMKGLVDNGYVKKSDVDKYNGYVKMTTDPGDGDSLKLEYHIKNEKFQAYNKKVGDSLSNEIEVGAADEGFTTTVSCDCTGDASRTEAWALVKP